MTRKVWLLSLLLCFQQDAAAAQSSASAQSPQTAPYTLSVESNLVIEDVSVLDKQGRTVSGLPLSAFHVLDNGKPETPHYLNEEHGDLSAEEVQSAAENSAQTFSGMLTNATLFRNRGTAIVLLIDPSTMQLDEQMYLRLQALKFVDSEALQQSMAVFRVNNDGVPVLLQPFTHDKALLRTAISAAVPTLVRGARGYWSAIGELANISAYLAPVPGRKAVLWLAGAFPLYQAPDYTSLCGNGASCGKTSNAAHLESEKDAYRTLEKARIAVYPIDVRGVQMGGLTSVPVVGQGPGASPGSGVGAKPTSETERATGQYDEMDKLADATGGQAFYSNNHVAAMLNTAAGLSARGYSLAYTPGASAEDGRWHTVKVTVDGPYTVHYRNGYYADDARATVPSESRRTLSVESPSHPLSTVVQDRPGPLANQPLIFTAHLSSHGKVGKTVQVGIRYVIPVDQLFFDGTDAGHAHFRVAAMAYNTEGDVLSHSMEVVDTRYTAVQRSVATRIGTPVDQTIDIGNGARYLLLAVEDLRTERVGTLQLPLSEVPGESGKATSASPGR